MDLVIKIIVWIVAGFLASLIFKGKKSNVVINLIIGIVGGFIGSWVFAQLGIHLGGPWWLWSLISATVGAIILLWIISLIRK